MNTPTSSVEHAARLHVNFAPGTHGTRVAGIYGTHAQLLQLASGLSKALSAPEAMSEVNQPTQILSVPATGLSAMSPNAVLLFFVASHDTPKPKPWGGPMFGSWWAFALALIGVVAIVKSVWSLVL